MMNGRKSSRRLVFRSSFIAHRSSFLPLTPESNVRILLGTMNKIKQIFFIANRQYELIEVDGPISRQNRLFPAQFDHEAGVLRISKTVPLEQRAWVVAVEVSDACLQMWKPLPVIWPIGWPGDRPALPPRPPGAADDRPHP
jgi:hypothetical protein